MSVWVKDASNDLSYVEIEIGDLCASVSSLKKAVRTAFMWQGQREDAISLFLIAVGGSKVEPDASEEALATTALKSTQTLTAANIKSGSFLLAQCADVAAGAVSSSAAAGQLEQFTASLKRTAEEAASTIESAAQAAVKRLKAEKNTFSEATVGDANALRTALGVEVDLQDPPPANAIAGLPHQWAEGHTEPREAPALRQKLISALQAVGVVIQNQEATAQQDPVVHNGYKMVSASAFPYSFQLGDTHYSGHGDAAIVAGTCPAGPSTAPGGVRVLVEWKSTDKMKLDEAKWGETSAQSMLELVGGTLLSSHDILVLTSDLITAHVFRLVGKTMQIWKGLPAAAGVRLVAAFLTYEASFTGGLPPTASEQRKAALQLVKEKLSNADAVHEMLEQITAFNHLPGLEGLFAMRQMVAGIADSWHPTPLADPPAAMYT